MRVVIQRVTSASVSINGIQNASIGKGLLLLTGFEATDETTDLEWMVKKICSLRIFGDAEGLMNLSVKDVHGGILVVSQFTLFASTSKGNRPSFIRAARPEQAIPLYDDLITRLGDELGRDIATGTFGADMQVALVNDGPVTISVDSRNRE